MTRDEAINKVYAAGLKHGACWASDLVDALVALGLLKTEEPLTPLQQAKKIAERFTHSGRDLMEMLHEFDTAGLTIVRKEDVK